MNYQYSYLIGTLMLLAIWLILFFWRKDTRKEMTLISIIFGIAGLIVDPIYSSDWWFPLTITDTMPGIESFIFGFSVAGIASIIYEDIFRKKLKIRKKNRRIGIKEDINYFTISLLLAGIFLFNYFVLKLNSFYSSIPAFLIPLFIIFYKRKDLVIDSVISGVLLVIISFVFYIIPEILFPGWINSSWNFQILSGITILKVPIEDLIWFFLAGTFIGPLYEYWQEGKLINKK